MSSVKSPVTRATVEPLPANITSVQPGGGFCYQVELAWGAGDVGGCKRFENRTSGEWRPADGATIAARRTPLSIRAI